MSKPKHHTPKYEDRQTERLKQPIAQINQNFSYNGSIYGKFGFLTGVEVKNSVDKIYTLQNQNI